MPSTITGRLRQPNNQPAANSPFDIFQENLNSTSTIYTKLLFTSQTNATGNFSLSLAPGIYKLIYGKTKDTLRFEVPLDFSAFQLTDILLP